jgi:hypothetical protein
VFYSSIEILFHTQIEKLLGAKHFIKSDIPPIVHLLPDALQYVLYNICNCCSDPCFDFLQQIHFLAAHMVFHTAQRKKPKSVRSGENGEPCIRSSSSYPWTLEIHFQTIMDSANTMNGCTVQLQNDFCC